MKTTSTVVRMNQTTKSVATTGNRSSVAKRPSEVIITKGSK